MKKNKKRKLTFKFFKLKNAMELLKENKLKKKELDNKYNELMEKYQEIVEIGELDFIESSDKKRKTYLE